MDKHQRGGLIFIMENLSQKLPIVTQASKFEISRFFIG